MAQVQYVDVPNDVRITRGMGAPKRVTLLSAWLREARKVIPQIPNHLKGEAYVLTSNATTNFIKFELKRPDDSRVYVIIDRLAPQLGKTPGL